MTSFSLTMGILTDGVPSDLIPYLPKSASDDFGIFPDCRLPGSPLVAGICVPATYVDESLAFCGEFVTYSTCVPPANPLWSNWTAGAKDALLASLFASAVQSRKGQESVSLETGGDYVSMLFTGNDACVSNYKKILCMYNFPQCGGGVEAFPLCKTRCVDYFTTCKLGTSGITSLCEAAGSTWPGQDVALADSLNCTGSWSESLSVAAAFVVALVAPFLGTP